MIKHAHKILVIGILVPLLLTSVPFSTAIGENKTIYVDDVPGTGLNNPPEDFTSIQDAINASSDGDTIYVYNGIYEEYILIYKSINLIGENKYTTIIDGMWKDDTIWVVSTNVTISGFYVINSIVDSFSSGIHVRERFVQISDCVIQYNDCGIRVQETSDVSIDNCTIGYNSANNIFIIASNITINNCEITSSWGGIRIYTSENYEIQSDIYVQNCKIYNNSYYGISIGNPDMDLALTNVNIKNNNISNNKFIGLFICKSEVTIQNNILLGNGQGDTYEGGIILQDVNELATIENNIIKDNSRFGIYLLRSTNNIIKKNNFISNIRQIGFMYDDKITSSNNYINNYYDNLIIPWMKLLFGVSDTNIVIPLINIDWNPAKEPYDI